MITKKGAYNPAEYRPLTPKQQAKLYDQLERSMREVRRLKTIIRTMRQMADNA